MNEFLIWRACKEVDCYEELMAQVNSSIVDVTCILYQKGYREDAVTWEMENGKMENLAKELTEMHTSKGLQGVQ